MTSKNTKVALIIAAITVVVLLFSCIGIVVLVSVLAPKDKPVTKQEATTVKGTKPEKRYKLGEAQQGEYWQYIPKKIKRTYIIGSEFSKKSAGKGQEFLLLFISIKNITNETQQAANFSIDPEPIIFSKDGQEYKYDSRNVYLIKDSFSFLDKSGEDVAPGGSQSGWLLFKIPTGKKGLKLQIEDFVWDLGI